MLSVTTDEPSDLLFQLNEEMVRTATSAIFVTATYLVYDDTEKKVLVASAGHLPTLILREESRKIEEIQPKEGMPLGLMERVEYSQEEIIIGKEDKVILYTDGVVEAKNLRREDFGLESLISNLVSMRSANAKETVAAIEKQIQTFAGKAPQHDDCTLIVLKEMGGKIEGV